jgi:hypothetical protein
MWEDRALIWTPIVIFVICVGILAHCYWRVCEHRDGRL